MKFVVKFLIARLTPDNLIILGKSLQAAGEAAKARQVAINEALAHVQVGVDKLTD